MRELHKRSPVRAFAAAGLAGAIAAASMPVMAAEEMEEVVVTGVRGQPRTLEDSPVPVDVFNTETVNQVAYMDTQEVLQTLVPSYNVSRQPISDGSSFIRPANLRGLSSDKTLVLVNGKRRHRASLVVTGGSGTQGPDVGQIPTAAIKTIEVLRDGASAQYGSDAIAGVLNFILKDNREGMSLTADVGEMYEGDGQSVRLMGNIGLPLGDEGFFSLSGEYSDRETTFRGEPYCESWFCTFQGAGARADAADITTSIIDRGAANTGLTAAQAPRATNAQFLNDPAFADGLSRANTEGGNAQPWGQPNEDFYSLFFNSALPLGDNMELYSFGNYGEKSGDGNFFYRYPGNGTIEDVRLEDGTLWNGLEFFPGGFTPRFQGEQIDYSFLVGLRGDAGALSWDISARTGYNEIEYTLANTFNPSLGPDSPTSFSPGDLSNEEMQIQGDFAYEFDFGGYAPGTFAFGFSYMDETYELGQGDPRSFERGPFLLQDPFGFCTDEADYSQRTLTAAGTTASANSGFAIDCQNTDPDTGLAVDPLSEDGEVFDPVYTQLPAGSNGFPGYPPDAAIDFERDSWGIYADLSGQVTEGLFLQAAARYEDYADFGDELVGKIAGQYRFTPNFAIRGSVGTGFRAPTPGQQGTLNISTVLPDGFPVARLIAPPGGEIAQALGAQPLQAETSTNYTFGITGNVGPMTLTVDFYRIDIEDRFFSPSPLDVNANAAAGSDALQNFNDLAAVIGDAEANAIGEVIFFQNAFDSKTTGVDVVATLPIASEYGQTDLTLAFNRNKSEFDSDPGDFFGLEERLDFEHQDPNNRVNMTIVHSVGRFTFMTRARWFGESTDYDDFGSEITGAQVFDDTTLVDVEASFQATDMIRVTAGARNIFDEFPDQVNRNVNGNDYCCGRVYRSTDFVDWQGGFWYLRGAVEL